MMKVHDLAPAPGSKKGAKRVGRGTGGKGGKTAGRGTKGQRARGTVARGFEGGQMPLKQRVPKLKGFNNPFRVEYQAVNLHTLADVVEKYGETTITPEVLAAHGLVHKNAFVKVLARGEISTAVELHVHAISKAAETAVTAAGGSVTLVPLPFEQEGKAGRPAAQGNQFTNR
jgi:large subunit ribosomal protein L15